MSTAAVPPPVRPRSAPPRPVMTPPVAPGVVPGRRKSRWRWLVPAGAAGLVVWALLPSGSAEKAPPKKVAAIRTVTIQSPPPAPPPPPPPPPPRVTPPEQKMIEQTPVNEDEPKPEEPKPADDPPDIGTGIKGDGPPDGFGLSGNRGAGGHGRGLAGSGGGSGSRWGWYAARVQSSIADALRRHPRLRDAALNEKIRIWPDASGRITRAKLAGTTGDPATDEAIIRALTGLQLSGPPPADMPAPILLRISARRP